MEYKIRLENESEYEEVEKLTREAFWNVHVPGCDEHYYLNNLRKNIAFIKELDFVALYENEIIGHIAYSRANIVDDFDNKREVIMFGPVSVLPKYQSNGIGGTLIRHSLDEAKKLGYSAVCIYGDPRYYSRFGFRCAEKYDIKTSDGKYCIPMMALELELGILKGISGRLMEEFEYIFDEERFEEFDSNFPEKKKEKTNSQEVFKILQSLRY